MNRALIVLMTLAPAAAFAHPGHGDHGLVSGFTHPLLGWDHLLAMVAVGMLAVLGRERKAWQLPVAFVAAMVAGALLGIGGIGIAGVEMGILASLMVLGGWLAAGVTSFTRLALVLCALFGLFHGNAHGLELPVSASAIGYFAGFVLATGLLHGVGWLAAGRLHATAVRIAGAAVAGAGLMAMAAL